MKASPEKYAKLPDPNDELLNFDLPGPSGTGEEDSEVESNVGDKTENPEEPVQKLDEAGTENEQSEQSEESKDVEIQVDNVEEPSDQSDLSLEDDCEFICCLKDGLKEWNNCCQEMPNDEGCRTVESPK